MVAGGAHSAMTSVLLLRLVVVVVGESSSESEARPMPRRPDSRASASRDMVPGRGF